MEANNRVGEVIQIDKPWLKEADWLVLIEFLPRNDNRDRARGAEVIGYMLGYAFQTSTRMLALVGDSETDAYKLLFSFTSPGNKSDFLRLLQLNDATAREEGEMMTPDPNEIQDAEPIENVLPQDVFECASAVAAMLIDGSSLMIQ